jgi:CheY-like chemotaxis protein
MPALRNAIHPTPAPTNPPDRGEAALPERAPAVTISGLPAKQVFRPGTRVVVAEDDRVSQAVLMQILQKLGLEVHIAGNGQRALELIRELSPELVMMDMQMPDLDGPEVVRIMRADTSCPQPAVVVMSASAVSEHDCSDLGALGVVDFLIKPVNRGLLYASLTRLLPKL